MNDRMSEILSCFDRLGAILTRQQRMLTLSQQIQEMTMAGEKEVRDEITKLRERIIADQQSDQAVVDALIKVRDDLTAKVAELQKEIDAGRQPAADFAGILSDLQNIETLIVPAGEPSPVGTVPGETPVEPGA